MAREKDACYLSPKTSVKPANNTDKKGYVPPKLPVKPAKKKK